MLNLSELLTVKDFDIILLVLKIRAEAFIARVVAKIKEME